MTGTQKAIKKANAQHYQTFAFEKMSSFVRGLGAEC